MNPNPNQNHNYCRVRLQREMRYRRHLVDKIGARDHFEFGCLGRSHQYLSTQRCRNRYSSLIQNRLTDKGIVVVKCTRNTRKDLSFFVVNRVFFRVENITEEIIERA